MIHKVSHFRVMTLYTDLSQCGGRHSGGGRGIAEAPGSANTINRSVISERLYAKIKG
jgi:hypothetical protein